MNSWPTMNESAELNQDTSERERPRPSPTSSRASGGLQSGINSPQHESSQLLRLPQIRLPPLEAIDIHGRQTCLRTCPSLHQHRSGGEVGSSTQTMLRKFFARRDDISDCIEGFANAPSAPFAGPSTIGPPGRLRQELRDNVPAQRVLQGRAPLLNQPPRLTRRASRSSCYDSQESFQSSSETPKGPEQRPLVYNEASKTYSPMGASSSSTREPCEDQGLWQREREPQNLFSQDSRILQTTPKDVDSLEADTTLGDLYRCQDCNRKCKSKASYLKHRSMMCTHRLGPLTLECRYCKRHYTYAGYLQRHEAECAKVYNSSNT